VVVSFGGYPVDKTAILIIDPHRTAAEIEFQHHFA
jgi:hypothetical protein